MKHNKGFTLTELLAVIVILAILMTSAGAAIISTVNKSKINTFKNEVVTMMDSAEHMYSEIAMTPAYYAKYVRQDNSKTAVAICVTLPGLVNNGYLEKDIRAYAGVFVVEVPNNGGESSVTAWVHNSQYGVNGLEKKMINRSRFKTSNNTEHFRQSGGPRTNCNASEKSCGPIGIVTNLEGLKKVIKNAYGKNDANQVGLPSGLINGISTTSGPWITDPSNPSDALVLYAERGGSGRKYNKIPCINTKLS